MLKNIAALCAAGMVVVGFAGTARAQEKDIVDIAAGNPDFSTLVTAVKAAGLVETLKGEGPFTVFAPTNAAFAKIPKAKLAALLKDKKQLTAVLTYHVVPGKVMAGDLQPTQMVKTVQGSEVKIVTSPAPMINRAKIVKTDIEASNGVIHVIDTVILPGKGGKMSKMAPKM
ncbi:MAG: fasciclin domain-containing protein [Capsulimonadales bacterium]|nr:fasciclin domain-containing protein [Capsulimonadales bacterium]